MCALEGVGDANEKMFISDGTDELEGDRQALRRETTRDGDGRKPAEIGRTIQAQQQGASGMIDPADGRRFFADQRGDNGCCGDY